MGFFTTKIGVRTPLHKSKFKKLRVFMTIELPRGHTYSKSKILKPKPEISQNFSNNEKFSKSTNFKIKIFRKKFPISPTLNTPGKLEFCPIKTPLVTKNKILLVKYHQIHSTKPKISTHSSSGNKQLTYNKWRNKSSYLINYLKFKKILNFKVNFSQKFSKNFLK